MLVLILALAGAALADATITVEKKPGKPLFTHTFPADAPDGAVHLHEQGRWTWTAVLYLKQYEDRLETCVDVQRLHPSKGREEVGRPCVTIEGRETPSALVEQAAGKIRLALAVTR